MEHQAVLTFTMSPCTSCGKVYDYTDDTTAKHDDGIYKGPDSWTIIYSGQKSNRDDWKLHRASNLKLVFKIYYRKHKNDGNFIYIGQTSDTQVLPDNRILLKIPIDQVMNVTLPEDTSSFQKYKKAVSVHAGLLAHNWLCSGYSVQ